MKLVLCVLLNFNKNRERKSQSHFSKIPSKITANLIHNILKRTLHEKFEIVQEYKDNLLTRQS